uniref:Uncharacterized protein n=1 Tax=Chromera velia CCMP2878 TaxID=1169474 RepID=A0A0G4I963_9ALVE|eukprot:Cvel_12145.t1-p1 / transcript=Cvel_12145.t1 / gene=Cvel_12145 / organism=Chromera_velia_CCMP2878 / gene_product=hypothetical protein / transcript_product=hypothetical protein / location=Cvel_scaffold783:8084-8443(-) / protein_length=120 / sequence_SO=supercontig / SO=protein_coding / is_pseudo=false
MGLPSTLQRHHECVWIESDQYVLPASHAVLCFNEAESPTTAQQKVKEEFSKHNFFIQCHKGAPVRLDYVAASVGDDSLVMKERGEPLSASSGGGDAPQCLKTAEREPCLSEHAYTLDWSP